MKIRLCFSMQPCTFMKYLNLYFQYVRHTKSNEFLLQFGYTLMKHQEREKD